LDGGDITHTNVSGQTVVLKQNRELLTRICRK